MDLETKETTRTHSGLGAILAHFIAGLFTAAILSAALSYQPPRSPLALGLYGLGDILTSAYGFSSLLIPLFFIACGLEMTNPRWTARRAP
jgi:Kef-type K+ transport system membrane component KefB